MKIIFLQNKYTYAAHQYWSKVSKIFHTLCLHLQLPAIMNLIFRTVRLEIFMTSCRDKLYHHTISNRIKFNFLIIVFGKTSSSKSLPLSGIEAEIERMNNLEKFSLTIHSWNDKSKVPVACGSNSVSDLAGTNDVATNGVNGRIGNKTLWKCEYCAPMEISIEAVCCLEMADICKPIFSSTSCLNVCRSDPHFVLWYSRRENFVSYLISTNVDLWQVRIKVFFLFKLRDYRFLWNILLY